MEFRRVLFRSDFTFVLKNAAGKSFRLLNGLAPAPSHEISRRPAGCSPAVPPFDGSPNRARYSTTFAGMSPVADMTVGTGGGVTVETPLSSLHAVIARKATASARVRPRARCMG